MGWFGARFVLATAGAVALSLPAAAFDLQGHRGARGLAPENTLAAFRVALKVGVTTIETDLALTADDVLVLLDDPRLGPALARGPTGRWVGDDGPVIRQTRHAELQQYDVGRLNPAHPYASSWSRQPAADGERVPTLMQLFALARDAKSPGGRAVAFSIETKLVPAPAVPAASADEFARAVVRAVEAAGVADRVTVQSFDWRSLLALKRFAPALQTACLTIESDDMNTVRQDASGGSPWHAGLRRADHGGSLVRMVQAAGCSVWSPFWRNLDSAAVAEARQLGLRVIPWTVNDAAAIGHVVDLGADGLITDYPDVARSVLARRGVAID